VVPELLSVFSGFGLMNATTRYLSESLSQNKRWMLRQYFYSLLLFVMIFYLIIAFLIYFFADFFTVILLGKPFVTDLVRITAGLPLAWILSGAAGAAFLGLEKHGVYAKYMVFSEILNSFVPLAFFLLGWGLIGVVQGTILSNTISGLAGVIIVSTIIEKLGEKNREGLTIYIKSSLKTLFKFGLPIWFGAFSLSGSREIWKILIARYATTVNLGLYSAAIRLSSVLVYVMSPVSFTMLPAFSKYSWEKNMDKLNSLYYYSLSYASLIVLPISMLMITLATPISVTLFGEDFEGAGFYLSLLALSTLAYGRGKEVLWRLLNSQKETKFTGSLDALSSIIGVALALVFIPTYGVIGYIITGFLFSWPSYFIGIINTRRKRALTFPFMRIMKLYISALITGLVAFSISSVILHPILSLFIGFVLGIVCYIIMVILTGAINRDDINRLDIMFRDQFIIGRFANLILGIMKKILDLKMKI
jgi:O-antigen/teichoic acid export membrane protein